MDSNNFSKLFGQIAVKNGFEFAFGAWFKESSECIIVLELQKSNFSKYYYLNIKTFIQGSFGSCYIKNKKLAKQDMGDILIRQPKEYDYVFDLESPLTENYRTGKLNMLFDEYINPFVEKALTRKGINQLVEKRAINLLGAVKAELERLGG